MASVLVVGGGIVGLLTARELAAAGATVTLIEMATTGRAASWAGGGILSPLYPWRYADPVTALVQWSQGAYPGLCAELEAETGMDPEHTRTGLLILDATERVLALDWARRRGVTIETLATPAIRVAEPELAAPPEEALWLPEVAHVRNPRLVKALRRALDKRVRLCEHEEVVEILVSGGRLVGARTRGGEHRADHLVVCAGAWTARLMASLEQTPAIAPVRGQMVLFHARPGLIRHLVLAGEHYAIPRRDGTLLFGSTLESAGFAATTTASAKEQLHGHALALFPALQRAPLGGHWAGLRPSSPSGIPYIGPHPTIGGLYVNAGHFRNGLVMAPASARLVADLILGREPIVPPSPYRLDASR